MKALVTMLIMGLVFTSPVLFAKNKQKAHKAKTKQEKPVKKEKKIKEETPAPQDDSMDAPADDSMDEGAGE
jgi:hypothetical protein